MSQIVPPPWQLTGNGIILLYHFPRAFVEPWLQPELRNAFVGGIGAVMCVDYLTSDCGPYRELLFIPGAFRLDGRICFSISKIYVSTMTSVVSGRANWGIPKEQAQFCVGQGIEHFEASDGGPAFFSVELAARGPHLPVKTDWSPLPLALVQPHEGRLIRTIPGGRSTLQFARVSRVTADGSSFPAVGQFRPLAAVVARGFEITFPVPAEQ